MLNLYAVKVSHASEPRNFEMIEVRAYSAQRAELLVNESFPGCIAVAERIADAMLGTPTTAPYFRPRIRPY